MSSGHADHAFLEVTGAAIALLSATSWTKVGSLPDCLALACFNDLDAGGVQIRFTSKQGASAPADADSIHYKLAAGEGFFANYRAIGHIFNSCDVYMRKNAVAPATGSIRLTGIKQSPLKFKG